MIKTPSGRRGRAAGTGWSVIRGDSNKRRVPSGPENRYRAGENRGLEPVRLVRVAVDLDRLGRIGGDPNMPGAEAERVTPPLRRVVVGEQEVRRACRHPGCRLLHDQDAEQARSVASMDRRGPMNPGMIWPQFAINTTSPWFVYDAIGLDPERGRAQSSRLVQRGEDVSAEPVPMLQVRGRGGHHPGVEPKAARDDERLGSRLGPRLAADRRSPRRPAEIDRRGLTNPDESDRRLSPTRDPERCREDVARPRRHDGERDSAPGHRGGCLAHGPVAADGRDKRRGAGGGEGVSCGLWGRVHDGRGLSVRASTAATTASTIRSRRPPWTSRDAVGLTTTRGGAATAPSIRSV